MSALFKFRIQSLKFKILLFLFSCLLFVFYTALFAPYALAQTYTQSSTPSAYTQSTPYIHPLSPQYADLMVINLVHTFSCFAEGTSIIGQPCVEILPNSVKLIGGIPQFKTSSKSIGALSSTTHFLALLYDNPPIQTSDYLASVSKNLQIIPEAKAQVGGSGNAVLKPIQKLWEITRNISYVLMIFVFIVVGFMIMFRQKINPQTVISAQAALPGLVIGLILITFSYFISALIVDTTYVASRVGVSLLQGSILSEDSIKEIFNNNILGLFNSFIVNDKTVFSTPNIDQASVIVNTTTQTVTALQQDKSLGQIITNVSAISGCLIGLQINPVARTDFTVGIPGVASIDLGKLLAGGTICGLSGGIAAMLSKTQFVGGLTGLILYVILILALLIAMFRLLFSLVVSYLTVIIFTIISPFYFLYASVPGKEAVAGTWFKTMFANVLVFPAVLLALIFAAYLIGGTSAIKTITGTPVDLSGGALPLLGGFPSAFLQLVLAYGVLLITPAIPDAVKEAFGVKGLGTLGQAGVGGFVAGFGVGQAGYNKAIEPIKRERQSLRELLFKSRYENTPREALRKQLGPLITWGMDLKGSKKKETTPVTPLENTDQQ